MAAAISPKLEKAAAIWAPPISQYRKQSQSRATPAVAAHSARKRRRASERVFISGA
jgi:hypothetical protein